MHQRALSGQIQQLKKELQEIETAISGDELPIAVLESFKEAVDNVRTTLWATMSTQVDEYEVSAAIAAMRMKRTVEMCRRIMLDIDAHEITLDTPDLLMLKRVLSETVDRVQRLYASGM